MRVSVRKITAEFSLADGRGEQQEAFCQSTQPWHNNFSVSQTDPDDSIYMFLIFSESLQRRCAGGCCSFYNITCTAMLSADAFLFKCFTRKCLCHNMCAVFWKHSTGPVLRVKHPC